MGRVRQGRGCGWGGQYRQLNGGRGGGVNVGVSDCHNATWTQRPQGTKGTMVQQVAETSSPSIEPGVRESGGGQESKREKERNSDKEMARERQREIGTILTVGERSSERVMEDI